MGESSRMKAERLGEVYSILEARYPDARLRLDLTTPLDLLVASILAARCRDEVVNRTTASLFANYRTAKDYADADLATLEAELGSLPMFRRKARSIKAACESLVAEHDGKVPADVGALTALKGVGRKTANLVLSNAFGQPAIVVDTHVLRICERLDLSSGTDRDRTERELMRMLPENRWSHLAHIFSDFGRETCKAQNPRCALCPVAKLCPYIKKRRGVAIET